MLSYVTLENPCRDPLQISRSNQKKKRQYKYTTPHTKVHKMGYVHAHPGLVFKCLRVQRNFKNIPFTNKIWSSVNLKVACKIMSKSILYTTIEAANCAIMHAI